MSQKISFPKIWRIFFRGRFYFLSLVLESALGSSIIHYNLPTFKVKRGNIKSGKFRTLHRNLLLKCNKLPTQPQWNKYPSQEKQINTDHLHSQNSGSDFSEEDLVIISTNKKLPQPNLKNTEREEEGEISLVNQNQNHEIINSSSSSSEVIVNPDQLEKVDHKNF